MTANQPREPIKSGSKRKFSPDEDGFLSDLTQEDDEFQFSRPGGSPQKKGDLFDFLRQDSPSKTPGSATRGPAQSGITKRKVLEPSMQPIWKTPPAYCFHLLTPIFRERKFQPRLTKENPSLFQYRQEGSSKA